MKNNVCQYCGTKLKYGVICGACHKKLELVRKLQSILRKIKRQSEVKVWRF